MEYQYEAARGEGVLVSPGGDYSPDRADTSSLRVSVARSSGTDLEKALGWFMWVKKGMEIFKDFVFDPWLEKEQVETYIDKRKQDLPPEEAFAALFG